VRQSRYVSVAACNAREDIERRGATTVSEILRNLPAQGGFTFDDQFTNGFAPGTSGFGLRNLG
jgi:iron complex outermembrane receptor protein